MIQASIVVDLRGEQNVDIGRADFEVLPRAGDKLFIEKEGFRINAQVIVDEVWFRAWPGARRHGKLMWLHVTPLKDIGLKHLEEMFPKGSHRTVQDH
jgi:hypothetical protein